MTKTLNRYQVALFATTTALLATASASAQSYTYSPAGYDSFEGAGQHVGLGSAPDGRCMIMDGELRGQPRSLREVAFRPSWTFAGYATRYLPNLMEGRSWTNVTLRISSCDMSNISPRFDANPTSTPTTVFSAPTNWPSAKSLSGSQPLPFSIRFPFQTPWTDPGREAVCMDFDFTGGKLTSSQPLASSPYFLSSFAKLKFQGARNTTLPVRGSTSCADSASPGTAARILTQVLTGGPLDPTPGRRNSLQLSVQLRGTKGPTILGLGQQGSFIGTAIPGISCARFYLDQASSLFLGQGPAANFTSGILPYQASFRGSQFWVQAAWMDSATRQLKLSDAAMQLVPELPPSRDIFRFYLNQPNPNLKRGEGVGFGSESQPVIRYQH